MRVTSGPIVANRDGMEKIIKHTGIFFGMGPHLTKYRFNEDEIA